MIKISEHFGLEEFVAPEIFNQCKEIAISFISERLVQGVEQLRKTLGKPIVINNWVSGGQFKNSGLRSFDCPEGAKWSDHKFGHAADLKITGLDSLEVQEYLSKNWAKFNQFFTSIEKGTVGWTHVSDRFIPGWDKANPFWIPIK